MPKIVDRKLRQAELGRIAAIAIAEYGYDQLTLAEVARRAGCSVGAVSHYAKSKDDILRMAYEFMSEDICNRITSVAEQHASLEALQRGIHECLPCASPHSPMYDNLAISAWSKMKDHAEIRSVVQGGSRNVRAHLEELFAEAQRAGDIAAHLVPAELAHQMQGRLRVLALDIRMTGYRPSESEQRAYADKCLAQVLNAPTPEQSEEDFAPAPKTSAASVQPTRSN